MKTIFSLLICLGPLCAAGQAMDSLAVVKAVDSLLNTATGLWRAGKHQEALPLAQQAADLSKLQWGENNARYAASLHRLASVCQGLRQYDKAEELYIKAIDLRGKVLGKEHSDYTKSLNNLGILYMDRGNYEKAEPFYIKAKDIREKTLGKENLDYAGSLNNLALLYQKMDNYEKAEPLYRELIAIREKVQGEEHPDYLNSLINLAILYMDRGNYEKAEPLYLKANAIWEKTVGKDHPSYVANLEELAILYTVTGNYEKAEQLFLEAKAFWEKNLGKDNPDYGMTLGNLGLFYRKIGNYEKAEQFLLEAKDILEKTLGKDHIYYIGSLGNLALLYVTIGKYENAQELYLEVKEIFEGRLNNRNHPFYINCLGNLAYLYTQIGQYEKAEPLYHESLTLREKVQGKEHVDYKLSLNQLAFMYEKQGRFSVSEPLQAEVFALEQTQLSKATTFLSQRELANYTATFQESGNMLSAYLLARGSNQTGILPALAFDHALFHKGFLLTAAVRLNTLSAASPESEEINARLKDCRRRLAAEYAKPIADRKGVAQLEEKAATAEKELARSVAGYAEAIRQVNWKELQAALKKEETAIEFVHFRVNFPQKTDSTIYAALLLFPGAEQPKFVPLFEEREIAPLLRKTSTRDRDLIDEAYTLANRGVVEVGKPQKTLYELLWQPLEKSLPPTPSKGGGDKPTIYYAPSGLLHRLNLDAIPIPPSGGGGEETLADRYRLVRLGTTRQLVVPSPLLGGQDGGALLFGGIRYELDTAAMAQANATLKTEASTRSRGEFSFASTDSTLRSACLRAAGGQGTWNDLPFTGKEVDSIARILRTRGVQTQLRKGYDATEEAFKTIGKNSPSPRILHIATHGFFFPDPKDTLQRRSFGDREPVFRQSDNPMIRSGLILAGANGAWTRGPGSKPYKPDAEDGILTAYEISQMDLRNTELVVLSACETGLGDIAGNEGVYGLQRAFKIAGAKYLIMSLWQVPDKQTSLLMTTFYQKWLQGKMEIPEAFRAAQKELRERGFDPYQWAGFVLVE